RRNKAAPYPQRMIPSIMHDGGGGDAVDYQDVLKKEGLVVVPTPLMNPNMRAETREAFKNHIFESPEFLNAAPDDPTWKPQLGGFAAMANPSAFHHPWVRKMREQMTAAVLETDAIPVEGRKLEVTFDRLLYRIPGETPTAESMHRDEAATALDGDTIFGGWVNFDDSAQYFSCCPRTHTDVGGQNTGFAKIPKEEYQIFRDRGWTLVKIPPGACLIFYERLVHEVNANTADKLSMRMFLGWRVTDADQPLFGTKATMQWIDTQGVPKIKSGQDPPVWPSAYSNFPRNFQTLTDWSVRTYAPQCIFTQTVGGSGAFAGTQWRRVKAKMLSLREYGLPLHRLYDAAEVALVATPSRTWELFTFDSPDSRVVYRGVRREEWNAYGAALRARPVGARVRRPRPELVNDSESGRVGS
ncbi:hypothetical protein N9S81_00510, partial [bacterium]|nr:hypothetical protein [bacterium]